MSVALGVRSLLPIVPTSRAGTGYAVRVPDEPAASPQPGVSGGEGAVLDGQADRDVSAAVPAEHFRRVLGDGVDHEVRAKLASQLELLVGDVDGGDGAAEDLGVLQGQVPEAANAGDEDKVARAHVADL